MSDCACELAKGEGFDGWREGRSEMKRGGFPIKEQQPALGNEAKKHLIIPLK